MSGEVRILLPKPSPVQRIILFSMILVDAHVHLYDCFGLKTFFDSALSNFRSAGARWRRQEVFAAILFLTEGARENGFQRIARLIEGRQRDRGSPIRDWTFLGTKETISILARHNSNQGIFVMAGRQIVTAENLEVLALGTEAPLRGGESLEKAIETIINADAIPVIPWGAGKWLGRRGRTLRKLLKKNGETCLFLGDNGGRPTFWFRPSHFSLAEQKGIRVLPGSDPLPFENECLRPGSFGFSLKGSVTPEYPAAQLKRLLLDPSADPRPYGELEKPYRFFRNQVAMQVLKRRCRQPHSSG